MVSYVCASTVGLISNPRMLVLLLEVMSLGAGASVAAAAMRSRTAWSSPFSSCVSSTTTSLSSTTTVSTFGACDTSHFCEGPVMASVTTSVAATTTSAGWSWSPAAVMTADGYEMLQVSLASGRDTVHFSYTRVWVGERVRDSARDQ